MKIALLSGASKNAGDFLIVKRSKELLSYFVKDVQIKEFDRSKDLDRVIEDINSNDVLVFAGGPAYVLSMYPQKLPLVKDLSKIKIPFFALAMGWKGISDLPATVHSYEFTRSSMTLLRRFERDGFGLGCRDFFSQNILRKAGVTNTIMTGCVAWYDLKHINERIIVNKREKIKKICISDPADFHYYNQFVEIVKYCQRRFYDAEIKVVFHRGVTYDSNTPYNQGKALERLCHELKELKIGYVDISYGSEQFSVYKECDLHIGYRVHAHIYNLSQRHRTILIEEDGRGAGVDQALGLKQIKAYDCQKIKNNKYCRKIGVKLGVNITSQYVCEELEQYLNELQDNDYIQFVWAFERMQYYFNNMRLHISQINRMSEKRKDG